MDKGFFIAEIEACSETMYRVAWSILRNETDVQDALQDAALKAWEKRSKVREEKYFRTWLVRILINVCYDIQRRHRNTVPLEKIPAQTYAKAPDPELAIALRAVPEKLRLPLVLCYCDGMSYEEAAAVMKVNVKKVNNLLTRGKGKLREELAREGIEEYYQ